MPSSASLLHPDVSSPLCFRERARQLAAAARPVVENVVVVDRTDSTQACALRLVEQAEREELSLPTTVVIADRQDSGIARRGRAWQSPAGGLYLSWLTPSLDRDALSALPMVAGAAAWSAITDLGIEGASIKWPNDILVGGRKLAGILINVRHGEKVWATVGIGVNLGEAPQIDNGTGLRATAVAELLADGTTDGWAEQLVRALVTGLAEGIRNPSKAVALWAEKLGHAAGDEITVRTGDAPTVRGRFTGVTDAGHLRLEVDGIETVIVAGDVVE